MPTSPVQLRSDAFVSVLLGSDTLQVTVAGSPLQGWTLHAIDSTSWYQQETARGDIRVWSSLDTLFRFVADALDLQGCTVPVILCDPLAPEVAP